MRSPVRFHQDIAIGNADVNHSENEYHPHSGLKMRSPREFIAAQICNRLIVR
jgi:hypothetical protein